MFERFTEAGIAIGGVDVGESWGSPDGRRSYTAFHRHMTDQLGFDSRPSLLARSRGGLMLYNWAAENAHLVACIAGIMPVCSLDSYPGIEKACAAYGLTAQKLREQLKA